MIFESLLCFVEKLNLPADTKKYCIAASILGYGLWAIENMSLMKINISPYAIKQNTLN